MTYSSEPHILAVTYSSEPRILAFKSYSTRQDPILWHYLLVKTPYFGITCSSGPHILPLPARQDLIFCLPKCELLIRTSYFMAPPARQDPIFCPV